MLVKGLGMGIMNAARRIMEKDRAATAFYARLQQGEGMIIFKANTEANTITYECLMDEMCVGFTVTITREVFDAYHRFFTLATNRLPALDCALLYYIHQRETSEPEDTLKARYGHFYGLFERFSSFSEAQLRTYANQKRDLLDLVDSLSRVVESPTKATQDYIQAKIQLELNDDQYTYYKGDNPSVSFVIEGGGKSRKVSFRDLINLSSTNEPISLATVAKVPSHFVTQSSFSENDLAILRFVPEIVNATDIYINKSTKSVIVHDNQVLVGLLRLYKGRIIHFDKVPYLVEEDEQVIKMFIDEDGSLSSSISVPDNATTFHGKSCSLCFDHSTKRVSFIGFANQKTKMLYDFYIDHPDFDYSLFQEEIGGFLLPKVSSETIVDKAFEEKTKIYRNSIKYFITYNEDQTLSMSTFFSLRGVDVTKEDFLNSSSGENYKLFKEELSRLGLEEEGIYIEPEEIAPLLMQDYSTLSRVCSLYLSDNIASKKVQKNMPIRVVAESGIDWFELTYQSDKFTDEQIQQVLDAYRKKKKYIRIGEDYFSLDNEELGDLAKRFQIKEGLTTDKLPIYQALRINHEGKSIVTLSKQLMELFHELNEYQTLDLPLDLRFQTVLRPYQLDGVRWLYSLATHRLGGILADDMGLGKSLEFISFLSILNEIEPVLIISPKSLIYNWESEFKKWDPSRKVYVISGSKSIRREAFENGKNVAKPIYVASYDTVRLDQDMFKELHYSVVVLDEGQYIVNAFAQKTKAVKAIESNHRFVLTGTPIQNSFLDLWSIFDFLLPGYLENYNEFQNIYRGYEAVHSDYGKKLEKMVAPFILRRKKDDVLQDLPPKTEEIIRIQFNEQEEQLYHGYLANVRKELANEEADKGRIAILAMLTRLRQLCIDPSSFLEYKDVSTKIEYTISLVHQAIDGGHKVLIFSTFAEILLHVSDLLSQEKITHHMIYGQTSAAKRLAYAEDFNNNPNLSVMLVSLKAGGTGLNLIGADIVVHLDPWWNIAAEEQATDRAHRIGQTRPVSVYKLIMVDSVEEKVIELQEKKKELTTILHSEGEVGASLSEDDLYYLLS